MSDETMTELAGHHDHDHHHAPVTNGVLDPVCGMTVDPRTAKHRADYRGHPYYFCSAGCKTKFSADPQKYLSTQEIAVEPAV
jgi:Cu+-exporting ATPase